MAATADIFISHSSLDDDFGREFASRLSQAFQGKMYEGHEVTIWYDATHIHEGDVWVEEISAALGSCAVFLLLLSPAAAKSDWVFKEFNGAETLGKKIIPIALVPSDELDLYKKGRWALVSSYQWVRFEQENVEAACQDVYRQIESYFGEKLQEIREEIQQSPEERLMQQLIDVLQKNFDHDKHHKHSRWDEVIQLSDMLIQYMGTFIPTDVYYMRGVALQKMGRYAEADNALSLALALMRPSGKGKEGKLIDKRLEYLEARRDTLMKMGRRWKELSHVANAAVTLLPEDRGWQELAQRANIELERNPVLLDNPSSANLLHKKLQKHTFGTRTLEGAKKAVTGLAWSPNSEFLAAASEDGSVYIWRAGAEEKPHYIYSRHQRYVTAVDWSPNGAQLASASRDKTVHIWRLDREKGHVWPHHDWVNDVAWSNNGFWLASACHDRTVQIWDVSQGKPKAVDMRHEASVRTIVWLEDNIHLAVGCDNGDVCIWNIQTGSQKKFSEKRGLIYDLAWLPESGSLLAASDDKHVYIWEQVLQGALIYRRVKHEEIVFGLTHSSNGSYIASSDGRSVLVWERESGKALFRNLVHSGRVRALAWAHDDLHIASAGEDLLVQVWRFIQDTQEERIMQG